MVSGSNPQFVLELRLETERDLPLVHLAEQTAALMPGTMVRLHVGNASPFSWCLPGVYRLPDTWFRTDLIWQFTGSNAHRLTEWQQVVAEIRGVK